MAGVDPAHPAAAAMAGATVFDRAAWVVGTAEVGGISGASFLFSLTMRFAGGNGQRFRLMPPARPLRKTG